MRIKIVTTSELNTYLSRPFNPPDISENFTKEAFYNEWSHATRTLKDALSRNGEHDSFGGGDFCIADDYYLSRGTSVELSSTRLMTAILIPTIASVLRSLPQPYSVYVDHSLLDMPAFSLVIERDRIIAHEETPGIFQQLRMVNLSNEITND